MVANREALRSGEEMLALAIIYLIKPSQLREYPVSMLQRVKILAGKVYNMYISAKTASRANQNQENAQK